MRIADLHRGTGQRGEPDVEEKLQRIDIEEHDEQKQGIENDGGGVVEPILAKEIIVPYPHHHQNREGERESREATHHVDEI